MRFVLLPTVLLLTIFELGCASKPAPKPPSAPVVIALVVDQLAAWIASERLPTLPPDGGFARLLREGTYVRNLRYAHAATETAPGHAALFTGAPPSRTG
ncbi:MAG: alkaline phosphatase family protein, partial [Clostridia bacterium]|nr:alkaline phosphatase family protein [Deltaproteobacteria bacterium]